MDRSKWTYKKLGEVGYFLRGKNIQKADFVEKGFPCIHYGQIHTKFGVFVERHLSEIPLDIYNKSIIASYGDVIIAITSEDLEGSCKSTAWLGNYDVAVSSHAAVLKHNLNPKYIAYYFRSNSFYYEKMKYARGFKVMEIKPTDLEKIPIPVPPLPEQERIVSELDLLSGIIEKKKAQLKEYDQLAQSIFYDMFGDPVTNEKGWEVKKLGEVCESDLGKTLNSAKDKGILYPYLCAVNVLWNKIDLTTLKQTRFEEFELERYSVKKGDLLVCEGGDIGRAAIWEKDESIQYQNALHRIRFKGDVLPRYCLMVLYDLKEKGVLDNRYGKGVTIKHLVKSSLHSIPIPLPPLSLQQSFAEKVEAIEKQKALIQQSIKEAETLFNSRMDYYFD